MTILDVIHYTDMYIPKTLKAYKQRNITVFSEWS